MGDSRGRYRGISKRGGRARRSILRAVCLISVMHWLAWSCSPKRVSIPGSQTMVVMTDRSRRRNDMPRPPKNARAMMHQQLATEALKKQFKHRDNPAVANQFVQEAAMHIDHA